MSVIGPGTLSVRICFHVLLVAVLARIKKYEKCVIGSPLEKSGEWEFPGWGCEDLVSIPINP